MDKLDFNWEGLRKLRNRFLESGDTDAGVYWSSKEALADYHATFAQRIGWKWASALDQAAAAGFSPSSRRLVDWGCGTGIASLRLLQRYGSQRFDELVLWDHSTLACSFAAEAIRKEFPGMPIRIAPPEETDCYRDALVLVSHALNELAAASLKRLAEDLLHAAQILLVEPGDYAASRQLVDFREIMRKSHSPTAPCTHAMQCPLKLQANARHWCHFFGKPPSEAFTQSSWSSFAQELKVDLRSLPYSYLLMEKNPGNRSGEGASRLIGRPRQFKGYARLLSCDAQGLRELELQKRDDKGLWKVLRKDYEQSLFRWGQIDGDTGRLDSGQPS